MRADDFVIYDDLDMPAGVSESLVEAVHAGTTPNDLEAAIALTAFLRREFTERGTSNQPVMTSEESRLAMRALGAVCARLNIEFRPPFRDFDAFHSYWQANGASGSWAARRVIVGEVFDGLRDALEELEEAQFRGDLAQAISPHRATGWAGVDEELAEMRRHFHTARTAAEYSNIGNDAVAVLEALSAAAYDPARHLREGEEEPAVDKTKQRLVRVVEDGLAEENSEHLKALTLKAIELAQAVKHNRTSTRTRAGVAADSVILLANIIRRIVDA